MHLRVTSGGQTGCDRAALAVALELHLPVGGWCPRGKKAEDGVIPEPYATCLDETFSSGYRVRTEWNVRDAGAVLILSCGQPSGGTALTIALAQEADKPHALIDLSREYMSQAPLTANWVREVLPFTRPLMVAGPRESKHPGIFEASRKFLRAVFESCSLETFS